MRAGTVTLRAPAPFDLRESVAFVTGFAPADAPQAHPGGLRLAFVDDAGPAVAISARQKGEEVQVDFVSDLPARDVERHAARILSLDVDAAGWPEVGERDPVLGRLQALRPGLRPVCFGGPFEAAAWAILSQRVPMRAAARARAALTEAEGAALEIDGVSLRAFPPPAAVAGLEALPGVWPVKIERLRALAEAAQAGDLDAARLRALPPGDALARLRELPGIGPFGAALVLIRGAGHPDVTPSGERRLRDAVARLYALDAPVDDDRLAAIAEAWAPFRSWASFLIRSAAGEGTAPAG